MHSLADAARPVFCQGKWNTGSQLFLQGSFSSSFATVGQYSERIVYLQGKIQVFEKPSDYKKDGERFDTACAKTLSQYLSQLQ